MKDLNVKYNNDRTRDYTNPNLPTEPPVAVPYPPASRSGPPPPAYYPGHYSAHSYPPNPYGPPIPYRLETPVLYVKNIDSRVTCDHLFILFGVYGDVERVKILPAPKSGALIEFSSPYGADIALSHLAPRPIPLFGMQLTVTRSNHYNIATPRSKEATDGQYKDFHSSPLHRFKRSGSKNYNHICPPCKSLHISNVLGAVTEEEVKELFSQYGQVENVRFFGEKTARTSDQKEIVNKMAIVQMDTLENAIRALVELHNHKLHDLNIKITFSERRPESREAREARAHPYAHRGFSGAPPHHHTSDRRGNSSGKYR
jgi:polypyrimidine tract-binding protein 1